MAPHSSPLAWKVPWTEEPGGLQSMGSLGVGQDLVTSLSLFTFMHWRRKLQPTPVFLLGESQGPGSMVGCRLWGHTELDTTEDPACRCQETKRENLACTRTCNLQNLNYLLSDPVPEFTYSCPVAAALFEGLMKTQWLAPTSRVLDSGT